MALELDILDPDGDLLIVARQPPNLSAFVKYTDSCGVAALFSIRSMRCVPPFIPSGDPKHAADPETPTITWEELRMKASLKHVTAASPYARRILKRTVESSAASYTDGLLLWEPEVVDLQAYKIVMSIIHGRTRNVPRSVDLELFSKIAVVVEDLECYESVEVFSELWIRPLEKSIPEHYGRDLVLWLLIAFVFHEVSIFRKVSRVAILQGGGEICVCGLPIRTEITDMIDEKRQTLLEAVMASLQDKLDLLRNGGLCYFDCDAMRLGALTKHLHSHPLFRPLPSRPFSRVSFLAISKALDSFSTPRLWRDKQMVLDFTGKEAVHTREACSLKNLLMPSIRELEKGVEGLHLEKDLGYSTNGSSDARIVGTKYEENR